MTRNWKAFAMTLVAAFAISALAAAAAQAEPEFHTEESSATLRGEQVETNAFELEGGIMECSSTTLTGTSSSTTFTEFEVEASYAGCEMLGLAAQIDMNGCVYRSRMVLFSNPPTTITDILCKPKNEITFTIPSIGCVVHIPPQNGIKHVVWTNQGSGKNRDIKANITEENITYTETKGCIFPGTYSNGVYFGTETFKAFNGGGNQQGFWAQ
jgi:hypothetical protein